MPKIDGVMMIYYAEESLYPLIIQRGDVDVVCAYPFNLLAQVVGKPNMGIWTFPQPVATEVLAINTRLYPLNMKEVRQAIDLALDKIGIAKTTSWVMVYQATDA